MKITPLGRPAEVLVVDDDPGDVYLAREGFKQSGWAVNVHHVDRGEKCLAYLRREGPYAESPVPDLILLDLNMPEMLGDEVLERLSANSALSEIPVIVMSTSQSADDISRVHALGCKQYIVKGAEFSEYLQIMRRICDHWFGGTFQPMSDVDSPGHS